VLERDVEKQVCAWAKAHGILAIKVTPMGTAGYPDRVFLKDGKAVFIEFKRPGGKLRPLQEHRLMQLRVAGFRAEIIDNVEDGIETLRAAFLPGGGN